MTIPASLGRGALTWASSRGDEGTEKGVCRGLATFADGRQPCETSLHDIVLGGPEGSAEGEAGEGALVP